MLVDPKKFKFGDLKSVEDMGKGGISGGRDFKVKKRKKDFIRMKGPITGYGNAAKGMK